MFVNMNDVTLPVTPSATPTAYAVPNGATRVRVVNSSGGVLVFEGETSSTVTLVAPVAGTRFAGTAMADGTVEMFNVSSGISHISIYSASGTGLVYIQFTTGDK
jgi:hypothetical protein